MRLFSVRVCVWVWCMCGGGVCTKSLESQVYCTLTAYLNLDIKFALEIHELY